MPSATFTTTSSPITLVVGRPFSLPCKWRTPNNAKTPINITGFNIAGTIRWSNGSIDLTENVSDAVNGLFSVGCDATQTMNVPNGVNSTLLITLTDSLGNTNDFVLPIQGYTP